MYPVRRFKDLPQELKPREKMIKKGPSSLSEEELVAIVLGSGTKEEDVLTLAEKVVSIGWDRIREMKVEDLTNAVKGLGVAKACQIKAVVELSSRINDPYSHIRISSPEDVYQFVKDKVDDRREHLVAVYLGPNNKVIDYEVVAIGRMNSLYAEPKDILYRAVHTACYSIVVVHNHPKGDLKPSQEDIEFTKRLKKACELLGFQLLDHLIINKKGYVSLLQTGLM
ncbi:DNA repair protein RadC [Thermocrinis albus DSM 14484]|uniref:DNA repair protein RadC n=1 Tax=Thermocrinis albus (strain DSM 14484 / JCM 11386 / HI 11/12) TaxID=638303 RepID=D3SNH3_THEAH|nr:DNA repair protein RadC [Thermocrinis albus]ADC88710.1 DNA repair protein RadC [Thermocrinis albus DSM 14484]